MTRRPPLFLTLALLLPTLLLGTLSASAQDVGRVSPASLPIPLPSAAPLPPDLVRARSPWNLPMTGPWRFQLTHGRIKAGQFQPEPAKSTIVTASTTENKNDPENAFDGQVGTRWCASSSLYPQWLQADLGTARHVSGVSLTWEFPGETYTCRIEGRTQGGAWRTLADRTAAPGIGDGPVTLTPADVRFVRITVLGTPGTHWASLREFEIRTADANGREAAWKPPVPNPVTLSAAARDAFAAPGYDDARWHTLAVPSNWEMAGYSLPTYNSVDNTVGLYRRVVTVPAAWAGRRIVWRFDGALDGAEVWVNGQKAGYHESGYTAWDIDLTGLVKPGQRNLFAVRVSKSTPSDDCETGDFQAMGGIYRDTSLIAVPQTHIADITVQTPLAANRRDATLAARVSVVGAPGQSVAVSGTLFRRDGRAAGVRLFGSGRMGADGKAQLTLSAPVKSPALWSAEKPSLYTVVFSLSGGGKPLQTAEERFGFRQVEVRNHVVLWNGQPIKCTGICRHDFWADRGFALTEANWVKDIALMKAANINAVRTSHYNHARRFLELCDEQGLYILDEVPYCWIGDQAKDPAYAPYLVQRGLETVARDKNSPCVLAWSLGNENPGGIASRMALDAVRAADSTRPAFVSGEDPAGMKGQLWKDDHYPGPDTVARYARDARWGANLTEHPHTFYEREIQDYDPGASDLWSETMIKTWDTLWTAPNILGAFIWEWQNQGIADKNADTTTDFYYGPDHMRQENNKGIVSAYRVPKPEWWIVKTVHSPVAVGTRTVRPAGGVCAVPLTNHYSFTDLGELTCRWTALSSGTALQTGTQPVACGPLSSVTASFPAPAGMTTLRLEFLHPGGASVIAFNLAVEGVPLPAAPAAGSPGGTLAAQDGPDTLTLGSAGQQLVFDKHSGAIQSWRVGGRDRLVGGPALNLGEAMTGGERGMYQAKQPPVLAAPRVSATPGAGGAMRVAVSGTVLTAAGGTPLGTLAATYDLTPSAELTVHWTLTWTAPDTGLWEAGLKLAAPPALSRMAWQRDSYFTDYPAGHPGAPSGTALAGSTLFRSSKRGLHWLTLSATDGAGVALLPAPGSPLVGRADAGVAGLTLLASRAVAGPHGLSGSWVEDQAIHAVKGQSLSGAFMLRAFDAPARAARAAPSPPKLGE